MHWKRRGGFRLRRINTRPMHDALERGTGRSWQRNLYVTNDVQVVSVVAYQVVMLPPCVEATWSLTPLAPPGPAFTPNPSYTPVAPARSSAPRPSNSESRDVTKAGSSREPEGDGMSEPAQQPQPNPSPSRSDPPETKGPVQEAADAVANTGKETFDEVRKKVTMVEASSQCLADRGAQSLSELSAPDLPDHEVCVAQHLN